MPSTVATTPPTSGTQNVHRRDRSRRTDHQATSANTTTSTTARTSTADESAAGFDRSVYCCSTTIRMVEAVEPTDNDSMTVQNPTARKPTVSTKSIGERPN